MQGTELHRGASSVVSTLIARVPKTYAGACSFSSLERGTFH
jgi:hypothetical protein